MEESIWQKSKYFKEEFISIGWNFSQPSCIERCSIVSADTETKMYDDKDRLLSSEKASDIYRTFGQEYARLHIKVKAYAFTIAHKDKFALFQNAGDFLTALAMLNVKLVTWYNARFDFAIFDYYFLTNNWTEVQEEISKSNRYKKMPDKTYQSLNGEYGQRYQMVIWKEYINRRNQRKVHKIKMIDICNIFGGGLKKNLEDWNIVDDNGNPIRKLEMDYDLADMTSEDDLQYVINDTKGLYYLTLKIDETISGMTGYSLINGDYITAGGLAKKTMLKYMFHRMDDSENIEIFHNAFPMSYELDKELRSKDLYAGGLCILNPYKVGKEQHQIYKYDVNSMYPAQMMYMKYPVGNPIRVKNVNNPDYIYLFKIKNLFGYLKMGKVPVWRDSVLGEMVERIDERDERYIWYEELQEYSKWYDLEYNIMEIYAYESKRPIGMKSFINEFYEMKSTKKGAVKQGAKLFLNSSYGKLSQKLERQSCHYELDHFGIVHLVRSAIKEDTSSMMSILVGSRVTSQARISLLRYIDEICQGNPKDNLLYCDTDSVHALTPYWDTDEKALGKMKCEGIYDSALYLAPKTYMLYNGEYEVHCKGVNTEVVKNEIMDLPWSEAVKRFNVGSIFTCLCAMNVKGGKALIYVDKTIVDQATFEKGQKAMEKIEMLYDGVPIIDNAQISLEDFMQQMLPY